MALSLSKKLSLMVAALFMSTAFAVSQNGTDTTTPTKGYDQGYGVDENQLTSGYNAPARIDVCGSWDFFVTGSFIYWVPMEKGLELGFTNYSTDALNHEGTVVNHDWDWKPGFKVGLGMNFEHDNWDMFIEYTRLHMNNSFSWDNSYVTGTTYWTFAPTWNAGIGTTATETRATGTWTLKYDIIDLELGRSYYNGTYLTLRPFFGGRGGWIKQYYNPTYRYQGTTYTVATNANDRSWLIGPRAGANMHWLLGTGFRFYSDVAASLMYQHFKTVLKRGTAAYNDGRLDNHEKETIGYLTPAAECELGFGWGTYFDHNNWSFDVSAGYEMQYYFNQNMMRHLLDLVQDGVDGSAGDLMLQGLTVNVRFDF